MSGLPAVVISVFTIPRQGPIARRIAVAPILGVLLPDSHVALPIEAHDLRMGRPCITEPVARAPIVIRIEEPVTMAVIAEVAAMRS